MKIPLPFLLIQNAWAYYLLRWGVITNRNLVIKSSPDKLAFPMSSALLKAGRGEMKTLLKMINAGEFEYHAKDNTMVVYSSKRRTQSRLAFSWNSVETVRFCLDQDIVFNDSDDDKCFMVSADGMVFYARKNVTSDVRTLYDVCIENEYGFLDPYIKNAVVLDVGANIGDTAVLFSKKGAKKIFAFEPHPAIFALAEKNIRLNDAADRVVLRNYGLGDASCNLDIKEDGGLGGGGGFGFIEYPDGKKITVRIESVRRILDEIGHIDVLKMDCEGAEYTIFEALTDDDIRRIQVICIEYHRGAQPIIGTLERCGFEVYDTAKNSTMGLLFASAKKSTREAQK